MKPLEEMIKAAKLSGFTVLIPENPTTYFWITDGQKIGYCQADDFKGPIFSTVHKPCTHAGTGYSAKDMNEALSHRPQWVTNDKQITKYKSAEEFIAKHWQTLRQY
jgi:hypothetical protein